MLNFTEHETDRLEALRTLFSCSVVTHWTFRENLGLCDFVFLEMSHEMHVNVVGIGHRHFHHL